MNATATNTQLSVADPNLLNTWQRSAVMLLLILVFLIVVAGEVFAVSAPHAPDVQRLAGRWVRTDGGYLLELRNPAKDGSVQAAYFNPRPINVARAELHQGEGKLTVFIELRDVNYPGSTYTLNYQPDQDRLFGSYYHALSKQQFEVVFER